MPSLFNRSIKLQIFSSIIAILLSSCVSAPKQERYFHEDLIPMPTNEESILVVYRKLTQPLALKVRVYLEEEKLLDVPNETFTWVNVKPGIKKIRTKWPAFTFIPENEIEIMFEAGNYYFVELVGSDIYTIPNVEPTIHDIEQKDYEEAVFILRQCCRYVPTKLRGLPGGDYSTGTGG